MNAVINLLFCGSLCIATSAASADDPMLVTYGNTVTTKNAKTGMTGELLFNADGTYQAKGVGADGKPVEYPGKWAVKGNGATLCLTPQLPRQYAQCAWTKLFTARSPSGGSALECDQ